MKLCSITPISQKEWMNYKPYTMLLAHLSKNNRAYSRWASELHSYKIMDNSIIELGKAFSLEDLLKQASVCKVNEIILPDVFQNFNETFKLAKESYDYIQNSIYKDKFKYMVVCHANSYQEMFNNLKVLENVKWIDTIGIPKVITTWGNRNNFKKFYMGSKKNIHYLGCWKSFKEEIEIKDDPVFNKIRSMDTCLPSLLTIQNKKWDEERDLSYTIDLEKDNISKKKYDKIMQDLQENLNLN